MAMVSSEKAEETYVFGSARHAVSTTLGIESNAKMAVAGMFPLGSTTKSSQCAPAARLSLEATVRRLSSNGRFEVLIPTAISLSTSAVLWHRSLALSTLRTWNFRNCLGLSVPLLPGPRTPSWTGHSWDGRAQRLPDHVRQRRHDHALEP